MDDVFGLQGGVVVGVVACGYDVWQRIFQWFVIPPSNWVIVGRWFIGC